MDAIDILAEITWEYRADRLSGNEQARVDKLNHYGRQGWEAFHVDAADFVYFKRKK